MSDLPMEPQESKPCGLLSDEPTMELIVHQARLSQGQKSSLVTLPKNICKVRTTLVAYGRIPCDCDMAADPQLADGGGEVRHSRVLAQ